jgi:hypothetical protein
MSKVTRLVYHIPSDRDYTIDLAKDLSLVNRKLHRQKKTYTVLGGQYKDSGGSSAYFKTAPHCWTTFVAIRRAFNTWRKANRELYKKMPGLKAPKYSDFKVYLDQLHYAGTLDGYTLTPVYDTNEDGGVIDSVTGDNVPAPSYQGGEWNYSTLVQAKYIDPDNDGGLEIDDNADNWDMHIVGVHRGSGNLTTAEGTKHYSNYSTIGVIRSWFDSRNIPLAFDPQNMPDNVDATRPGARLDPLSSIFDVQDDDNEMAEIVEAENDQRPYDVTNVPGMNNNELQLVAFVDNSAGEPDVVSVPGFQAPCGLIRIKPSGNNGAVLMLDVLTEGERI